MCLVLWKGLTDRLGAEDPKRLEIRRRQLIIMGDEASKERREEEERESKEASGKFPDFPARSDNYVI